MKNLLLLIMSLQVFLTGTAQNLNLGLLACYPFSGNANDASGNGHNGSVMGPVLTTNRFNVPNEAFRFDGYNDYINLGLFSSFTNSNDFSVSVWILPGQVKLQTILMVNPDDFSDRFNAMANYDHNGISATVWDFGDCTAGGRLIQLGTLFSPVWQHWVFTVKQGAGMNVYKNGVLEVMQASHSQLLNRSRYLWIGGGSDAANAQFYFDGKIDDMRLYDRELTPVEVQTLYATQLLCDPTALPDAFTHKNLFSVHTSGSRMRVQVDPSASDSQFRLYGTDGKLLYTKNNVKGGDEFDIDIHKLTSGFVIYSFRTMAGIISGKVWRGK